MFNVGIVFIYVLFFCFFLSEEVKVLLLEFAPARRGGT